MVRNSRDQKILAHVRAAFVNLRKRNGREQTWYPEELKKLVLEALTRGLSQFEVAQAAGISVNSIKNWKNGRKSPAKKSAAPVELKLVERRESVAMNQADAFSVRSPSGDARIWFQSGVIIELPTSYLTQELLGILMRGAP
jgi:transcriptional regulator with XRE-family HTH domain